jgi:hypothetical protein
MLFEISDNAAPIKCRSGETYVIRRSARDGSRLDAPGKSTCATLEDILAALTERRAR